MKKCITSIICVFICGLLHSFAAAPQMTSMDYMTLQRPQAGDSALRIVSPTVLELQYINSKSSAASKVEGWDFVNSAGSFTAPSLPTFVVTVNGLPVAVESVGFKRRVLSAPLTVRDIRVENMLYLRLAKPVPADAKVEVINPTALLWSGQIKFATKNHSLRYSPAIHVNQEGYMPGFSKQAMIGYYLGNLGEMDIPTSSGFQLINTANGSVAYSGALTLRKDEGFTINPKPYQKVYQADFTSFDTPGEYMLVIPGLGASVPFLIDNGVAMKFTRTYALGLYHQRSGAPNELPYTRFTHQGGHTAPAAVPVNDSAFAYTWSVIASEAKKTNSNNPAQKAPQLTKPSAQLYPFINKNPIDVSGGHHDAGDYSKYTINSASLIHFLLFTVDSLPGAADLDNLGLPESSDGVSDILQLAKWEADFLAKLQDDDGGFYFLVYPRERRYENNVLPDAGDLQVVWPKTTASTAAAVAALAEMASSPRFKAAYPKAAEQYMQAARNGWEFLTKAIDKHGKAGSYQKITHYGDDFTHDDELAWAAAAMFAATGDAKIHNTLKSWYDPSDPANRRWGWWHAYMGWGNALRSYAFAARSGRLKTSQPDAAYLAKCEAELIAAGNHAMRWSDQNAYGTSFPDESKRMYSAGWYFSSAQAFDITVAHQIAPKPGYIHAIIANLNFEAGTNPVNVSYVTGLGRKRQHEIVHQYAQNDRRILPPAGIPLGNLQTGPIWTGIYGTELSELSFPRDNAGTAPYALYDRWSDTFNVTTEFVHLDQARSLASLAFLAAKTPLKNQKWKSGSMAITGLPGNLAAGTKAVAKLNAPGYDLTHATIVWEASGQEPAFGPTYTFTPSSHGQQWIEAEVTLPDGRRLFAVNNFFADNGKANVSVVATDAVAVIGNNADTAAFTFTRTGSTAKPLTLSFSLGGSAAKWSDYRRPEGDMPASVTIPAGASSYTMQIRALANSSGADPLTIDVTVNSGADYNAASPRIATASLLKSSDSQNDASKQLPQSLKNSQLVSADTLNSEWFGRFRINATSKGWINSEDHGWIYVWQNQPDGMLCYWDPAIAAQDGLDGFAFTYSNCYPYVYINGAGWTYFHGSQPSAQLRLFHHLAKDEGMSFDLISGPLQTE